MKCCWMSSGAVGLILGLGAAVAPAGDPAPGLLFHASFDAAGTDLQAQVTADHAAGEAAPRHVQGVVGHADGRYGSAIYVPPNARLAYDALANMLTRRGTLAFWVQPDAPLFSRPYRGGRHPVLLYVTDLQTAHGAGRAFQRISVNGPNARLQVAGLGRWSPGEEWMPGVWQHVAITWDAARGRTLYHNGVQVAASAEVQQRFPGLGVFNLGSQIHSGTWGRGAVDLGYYYDEVYVFDYELDAGQIAHLMAENQPPLEGPGDPPADRSAAERQWLNDQSALDDPGLPRIGPTGLAARRIPIARMYSAYVQPRRTARILTARGMDGKEHTGTFGEQVHLHFHGEQAFNFLRLQGDFQGALKVGSRPPVQWSAAGRVQRHAFAEPVLADEARLVRAGGVIHHLDAWHLSPLSGLDPLGAGAWRVYPDPALPVKTDEEANAADLHRRAYYGAGQGAAWTATPEVPAPARVALQPWKFYHIVTAPLPEDRALDRILLDLRLDAVPDGGVLVVRLYDPVTYSRRLLEFEARFEGGPGVQPVRLLVDDNDYVFEAGRRLWFAVMLDRPAQLVCGPDGTALAFAGDLERHGDAYLAQVTRIAADLFVSMSEPQPWSAGAAGRNPPGDLRPVGDLFALCEHILHFRPREPTAAALLSWMLRPSRRWLPEAAARYSDPLADFSIVLPEYEVPDWAVVGREALKATRAIVDWWIRERQDPETGQFGGGVSDDTTLVTGFVNFALIGDPEGRLREAVRRLADHTWDTWLHDGLPFTRPDGSGELWPGRARDHLHTYEEGTNVQHLLARLFYGDPEAIERLLITSRWYENHLTGINPDGQRLMRSANFSASVAAPERGSALYAPYDNGMSEIFMPGRILTWYNRNPTVMRVLLEWMDAWLYYAPGRDEDIMRRDYFGSGAIDFATGRRRGSGNPSGSLWYHLYWAYDVTRDERYRDPVLTLGRGGRPVTEAYEWHAMAPDEESIAAIRGRYGDSNRYPYLQWRLSWNPDVFWRALHAHIEDAVKYLPIHTWVGQSTDRIRIPDDHVAHMFLGGKASQSKRLNYHFHAVSWEEADDDIVRYVTDKGPAHLAVKIFNFHPEPREIGMRVWQLDPGRYRVRTAVAPRLDGSGGRESKAWEQDLWRYESVALTVPPRETFTVEIDLLQAYPGWLQDRPDWAVNPRTARLEDGVLTVSVHNIGSVDAPETTVALRRAGRTVSEQSLPALRAPNDLQPSRHSVRFTGVNEPEGWEVVVDPEQTVPEITRVNNTWDVGEIVRYGESGSREASSPRE